MQGVCAQGTRHACALTILRRQAIEAMAATQTKRWSQRVTEASDALDLEQGVFTKHDPKAIARSLKRSAERSHRRKADPVSFGDVDADLLHQPCRQDAVEDRARTVGSGKGRASGAVRQAAVVAFLEQTQPPTQGRRGKTEVAAKPIEIAGRAQPQAPSLSTLSRGGWGWGWGSCPRPRPLLAAPLKREESTLRVRLSGRISNYPIDAPLFHPPRHSLRSLFLPLRLR